jgi:hypothetical protein
VSLYFCPSPLSHRVIASHPRIGSHTPSFSWSARRVASCRIAPLFSPLTLLGSSSLLFALLLSHRISSHGIQDPSHDVASHRLESQTGSGSPIKRRIASDRPPIASSHRIASCRTAYRIPRMTSQRIASLGIAYWLWIPHSIASHRI